MRDSTRRSISEALQAEPKFLATLRGGCISEAFACQLDDGRKVFLKIKEDCDSRMFRAEAKGLAWLAEAKALRTPKVLAVGDAFLALELIEPVARSQTFDHDLGRGLARLHRSGADALGANEDGFLATLEQDNKASANWAAFYTERRLEPLVRRAIDQSLVPASWGAPFEKLYAKLPQLLGDEEDIARLHGDLWSGNVHTDESGNPVLIDPAAYAGHREIDLAMLHLFGSPSPSFYMAYEKVWPLEQGHRERIALYQLYPLLAHVNLFGGSYIGQCEEALQRYL